MRVFTTIKSRVLASFSVISALLLMGSIGGYIAKEKDETIEKIVNKALEQKTLISSAGAKSLEYVIQEGQANVKVDLNNVLQQIDEIFSVLLKRNEGNRRELTKNEGILLMDAIEQYGVLRKHIDNLLKIRSDEITVEDGDILILLEDIISARKQVEPRINEFINSLNTRGRKARAITLRIFFGATLFTLILIPMILNIFSRGITRPLANMVEILKDLAEGEGDLTRRIDAQSDGEIKELTVWMNTFIQNIQEMVRQIKETMTSVSSSSQQIFQSTDRVKSDTEEQSRVIGEIASSIDEMERMNREIAQNARNLASHTDEASSSIMEMSASIEEVANNANDSSSAVEETASSITEMGSAINEISENVDSLSSNAEQTASFTEEINRSVQEIEKNAKDSLAASKESVAKAQGGMDAVAQTEEGMSEIKETFEESAMVIKQLGERSVEIGKILSVIDEVTEQTNLLALNAAIIAAQAGEHGKGFAVVADEIKSLAERVAASSSDISKVILSVQNEAAEAVQSMEVSASSITRGMELSRQAKEALQQIMESVNRSRKMIEQIEQASSEQAKGSQMVKKAVENITDSLRQIVKATLEQKEGSGQIIENTERLRTMINYTTHAMREMAQGTGLTTKAIEEINSKTQDISLSTENQAKKSEQILTNSRRIEQIAVKNTSQAQEMTRAIIEMGKEVKLLQQGIDKFKV